jgi:ABC-2 type transport system permease protein
MTALLALIRKDLILYVSNRRALLLNLLVPIALASLMGYVFGGAGGKQGKLEIGLVALDRGAVGMKIADGLKKDDNLKIVEVTEAQAQEDVRKGKLSAAVVIPAGFGEAAGVAFFRGEKKPEIAVYYDPSQAVTLAMVKGILTQHVMQDVSAEMFNGKTGQDLTAQSLRELETSKDADAVQLRQFLGSLQSWQKTQQTKTADSAAPAGLSMPFSTRDQPLSSGHEYNYFGHAFAGMGVQFILFFGIDVGIGVLLARQLGIWNRLQAAPVSLNTILLARLLSCALIAFGLLCGIFAAAIFGLGVRISGSVAGFVGIGACFALMTASFGLFIAAFGKTPEAARGIAIFATLIMVVLGGAWMPAFLVPAWMQQFTLIMPTRWAVDGFDAMLWRGLGIEIALRAMAVLLGFAAAFGALAFWRFRRTEA